MFLALLIAAQTYGPQHLPPVIDAEDPLVDAAGLVPGLIVDLAYARADNIAGRALYPPDAKCWLRRSVAQRVAIAADALHKQGFRLVARRTASSLAGPSASRRGRGSRARELARARRRDRSRARGSLRRAAADANGVRRLRPRRNGGRAP